MEISLGFLVIITFILFPGLIYRKLYFYGEFSKEFSAGQSLPSLLGLSSIPGLIITILCYISYRYFFVDVDLDSLVDKFKDINNPEYRHKGSSDPTIKSVLFDTLGPFIVYVYLISTILGSVSGRIIRIARLDIKFKILRFKNNWFYLFNGQHIHFKKLKFLKEKNKKYLFTKADILVDSNSKSLLYSGIVVDYELDSNDCSSLSKIVLRNAERYKLVSGTKQVVKIPGNLFVVDCSAMKNINLTYIYEKDETENKILKSRFPQILDVSQALIIIILIPLFIFTIENFDVQLYLKYLQLKWYAQIIAYFLAIQVINILNPFIKQIDGSYEWVSKKIVLAKLVFIAILLGLLIWLS